MNCWGWNGEVLYDATFNSIRNLADEVHEYYQLTEVHLHKTPVEKLGPQPTSHMTMILRQIRGTILAGQPPTSIICLSDSLSILSLINPYIQSFHPAMSLSHNSANHSCDELINSSERS